jgi:hypothetical protein
MLKARLGYWLFGAGCRLIARGARLLPSIRGWSADVSFTDDTAVGSGEILNDEHWRGIRLPAVGSITLAEWVEVEPTEVFIEGRTPVVIEAMAESSSRFDKSLSALHDPGSRPPDQVSEVLVEGRTVDGR